MGDLYCGVRKGLLKKTDEKWMALALKEALKGQFRSWPNPWVGAVLVKNGRLISKGAHTKAGGLHAEIVALKKAKGRAQGADLYVTLEPCNHFGKTPPCSLSIFESGVKRVIYGVSDKGKRSAGGGANLKKKGLIVKAGVLKKESEELHRYFLHKEKKQRPWVTLKAAATLDGRAGLSNGESKWITSSKARQDARELRGQCEAVLVGGGTLEKDDPGLLPVSKKDYIPWRIILDPMARAKGSEKVFTDRYRKRTIWLTSGLATEKKLKQIQKRGCRVVNTFSEDLGKAVKTCLPWLARQGISRLMIEGGPTVLGAFLNTGMADEMVYYLAPKLAGSHLSQAVFKGKEKFSVSDLSVLKDMTVSRIGTDLKIQGYF